MSQPSSSPEPGSPREAGTEQRARRPSSRRARSRYTVAVVVGAVCAAAVVGLGASGLLRGYPLVAAAVVVALAVPTSRELSRRALIAGAIALGWAPFLWWWNVSFGSVGRVVIVIAIVVGGLAGWTLLEPRRRLRALRPRVRLADGAAAFGGLVVTWLYWPTLRVETPQGAISAFLRAWDNVAHFDMTEMIRVHGTVVSNIPQGAGRAWSYARYPQGFHAATASVMEMLTGPAVQEPGAEVVTYSHAMTLVVIAASVTVLAGVCSLPALRRRPGLALPSVALVVATFGLGPGGMVLHNGFPNFLVACALLACVVLLATQMTRPCSPALLAALGGSIVGVAHNWSFLITMGAFGAVALAFPLRRARWPADARSWFTAGAISAATLAGVGSAWLLLRTQAGVGDILSLGGPIDTIPVSQLVATAGLAVAACLVLLTGLRRAAGPFGDDAIRTAWIGLVPLAGIAVAFGVALAQVQLVGQPQYYFWKYAIAVQLVSVVVIVVAVPLITRNGIRPGRGVVVRASSAVASVVAAAVVFQLYGLPMTLPVPLGTGKAPGGLSRADFSAVSVSPVPDAAVVLAAARAHRDGPEVPYVMLPFPMEPVYPAPGSTPPPLLQQWFLALTGRFTEEANLLIATTPPADQSTEEAVRAARRVLEADPEARVVIGPEFADSVRAAVTSDGWAERVLTW